MKKITLTRKAAFALVMLLFAWNSNSQLNPFTLTATATAQTCTGNGSISFSTSGTTPGASLDYTLYLLPNTTDPVTVVTASPINSLSAGTYQLVATQSMGTLSNTQTATVTVGNEAVLLEYNLVPTLIRCGNDGKITVNVTEGTAVSYEIISGPVIVPQQASSVFNNLPVGQYQVRVHDNCGDALVTSIQLIAAVPALTIGPSVTLGGILPGCNTVTVTHNFSSPAGTSVFYPVTVAITVFPPGGGTPIVVNSTLATGPSGLPASAVPFNIPFYNNQSYTYNIVVTDACGNVYTRNNNTVNAGFVIIPAVSSNCADNLFTLFPNYFVPPYTVQFTSAPAGFVPTDFNAAHPTFSAEAIYFSEGNSVPTGSYTVLATDSCGRTSTVTFETVVAEVQPQVVTQATGCNDSGSIEIDIPGRTIEEIEFTAAPITFDEPLPFDASAGIGTEGFFMDGLPLGAYTIVIVDSCGDTHTVVAEIEFFGTTPVLAYLQRPGCAEGFGSVRIINTDSSITAISIVTAPPAFPETLPFNASANLTATGVFYMNSLPEGVYTISITDECGVGLTETMTIQGYHPTTNNIDIIENCNSFDLTLQHASNGNYLQAFFLQEFNPDTNTWGHPLNGAPYTEGTLPNITNSVPLVNNTTNISLGYTGIFRVVKVFYVMSNGSAANFRCVTTIHEFEFTGRPIIHAVYGFPCSDGLTEVAVDATGLAPLTYEITEMNGGPFSVNNGTSNLFSNLAPGMYNFRVTDVCGSFSNSLYDINELEPLAITAVNLCEGEDGSLSVPQFSFLNYEWVDQANPNVVIATTNTLAMSPFDNTIHPGTYEVRVFSSNPASCIDTTIAYVVEPNDLPNAGVDTTNIVCNVGEQVDLNVYLATGHDTGGTWTGTTPALDDNILDTNGLAEGMYQFTYAVTGDCDITDDAVVTIDLRNTPIAPVTTSVPPVCEGANVQLAVAAVTNAVYQWSGPDSFTSAEQNPLLSGVTTASAGDYSVRVTVNGCTSPPSLVNVTVNAIPQFSVEGNTVLCIGQSSELTVVPGNFVATDASYEWYFNDELQPADTGNIVIDQTGMYEVIVTNGICTSEARQILVTENTGAFEVVLEHGCREFEYFVTVVSPEDPTGEAYTYEWTGPEGYSNSGSEIHITNLAAGTYTVVVQNSEGCTDTEFVEVENTKCAIPKGISPGDAENNNEFDLSHLDVQLLQIFNRYGLEVYEKENYIDEWHGQSDKGDLPTGTYYYVVSLTTGKRVTGWVYVQRQN